MTQKKDLRSYLSLSHDDQKRWTKETAKNKRQFQQTNKFAQDSPTYTSTGWSTRLLSQAHFHSHQIQDPYPKTTQMASSEDIGAAPDCWGCLPQLPIVKPPGL
jgi:hypothetical protein